MRRELREWKRERGEGIRYKELKRKYDRLCDRKKKEENDG